MSDSVDRSLIRRHSRSVIAGGVLLVALLVVLGPIAFETAIGHRESERQARRLAEALAIGDSKQRVEEMIARNEYERLALVKIDSPSWLVRTPELVGATNWVIWLDFDGDKLSRVAVRTADSARTIPGAAPPDKP